MFTTTLGMKSILLKIDDKVKSELEMIKEGEGLGNQTATVIFLIKYYLLTKGKNLDTTLSLLDKVMGKIDPKSIPSLEEQLKDL